MTNKIKILYVITKSNFGGAQRYVFDLTTNLPRDEYDITVALGGTGEKGAAPGSLKSELEKAGVRTIVIKNFLRNMSLATDARAFFELWKVVRKEKPDVLHVSSSKAGGLGAIAGRLAHVQQIVFTSHGLTFDESWRPMWQRTLIWLFTWLTILFAKQTILISQDNLKRVQKMPFTRNKVSLIHNGIAAPNFLTQEDARSKLYKKIPDNNPWIGTIAEYHPNKNLQVLIEALQLLHAKGVHAHLVLIGEEAGGREYLAHCAEEHQVTPYVHLVGRLPNAAQYLKAFDIFALPSKKEGLPYVLIEAGYADLPVVASNIPGNQEIVEHEMSGLLVEAKADAFAQALHVLLSDDAKANSYKTALHSRVLREFSIQHMLEETTQLYTPSKPSTSRSKSSCRTERS